MSIHWEELLQPGQMQKLQMDPGRLRSDGRFSPWTQMMHQRFVVNVSTCREKRVCFGPVDDLPKNDEIKTATEVSPDWCDSVAFPGDPKICWTHHRTSRVAGDLQDWSRGFCLAAGWGIPGSLVQVFTGETSKNWLVVWNIFPYIGNDHPN